VDIMVQPVRRRATYQDILDAPEHKVAEILDGELFLSPRPGGPHTSVTSTLGEELGPPFKRGHGGPGGWIILDEPELHLADDVLVPDLGGWRRERLPHVPDAPHFDLPPDWVCEALSRSTEKIDRGRKLRIYAAHGVKHIWLVSAERRMLEVMRLHEGNWLTLGVYQDEAVVRAEPFDAIELDLANLWADLASRVSEPAAEYASGW
jgi:Uma2 family endonuclease